MKYEVDLTRNARDMGYVEKQVVFRTPCNSSLVCSRKPSKGDADPSDSNIKKIIKGKARPYWNDVVIEHIFESMKCFQMQAQKCPW